MKVNINQLILCNLKHLINQKVLKFQNQRAGKGALQVGHSNLTVIHDFKHEGWKKWSQGVL